MYSLVLSFSFGRYGGRVSRVRAIAVDFALRYDGAVWLNEISKELPLYAVIRIFPRIPMINVIADRGEALKNRDTYIFLFYFAFHF